MRLDQADRQILRELQAEGRLSNVDLAKRVGMSESPCLRRVRRLEQNDVISGYAARVDRRKLGLDVMAFIQVNLDQRSEADTAHFLKAVRDEPAIVECYAVTGNYDYLLKVTAADLDEFGDLTMARILKYPGVTSIVSGLVLKAVKEDAGLPV